MKRPWPILPLLAALGAAFILLFSAVAQQRTAEQQDKAEAERQTITGVVDQTRGAFVISTEDRLRPIAKLRGDGFSDDNFARFVGLKVKITGRLETSGDTKVLRVRSLNDIVRIGPTTKE